MTIQVDDFKTIRTWDGSKHRAFEELCYQLRDRTPPHARLVKTGDPDGGVEWYWRYHNGVVWGWQVKYIFDTETLLSSMRSSLKTVVEKRPECRRLTFCIPYDLPASPGKGKSARQKFEDRKVSWQKTIPGAKRVKIELWSGGDVLQRLVKSPNTRGIQRFFWDKTVFSPEWLASRQITAVKAAGQRYRPDLHVDVPVAFSLEGLALSEDYWERYLALSNAVTGATRHVNVQSYARLGVTQKIKSLRKVLKNWHEATPKPVGLPRRIEPAPLIATTTACIVAANQAIVECDAMQRRERTEERRSQGQQRRISLRYRLVNLTGALTSFKDFLQSSATTAATRGALLLTGEAGQGKTHLLCDTAQRAIDSGRPAIMVFGGRLSGLNVWSEISAQFGLGDLGSEELIGAMQSSAEASNAPFLLLIDALNDVAEPSAWKVELPHLLAELAQHPWISVCVSVRSTYEQIVLPNDLPTNIAIVEHPGFRGREEEAAEKYFKAHGLQQPQVPLLTPEFSNPLFLVLYCEGLQGMGPSTPVSGKEHITEVFGRYLEAKETEIVSQLKLDISTKPARKSVEAFSEALAERISDSIPYDESVEIINSPAPHLHNWPDTLMGQLLSEGVLTRDVARTTESGQETEVVRFTYQSFSDLMVGASILAPFGENASLLRNSVKPGEPLAEKLLKAPAGWIEALSVQVPERLGVELLDVAQAILKPHMSYDWDRGFILSVAARRDSAITPRTIELLSEIQRRSPRMKQTILEMIASIALRPEHPLNANYLHCRLVKQPMPERDVEWSIPTYTAFDNGGALEGVIRWAARGPNSNCPDEIVELAALILIWTFTSPNRRMRDYATKALVQLLSGRLDVLPAVIRRFEGVDDPYVVERLVVVAHGAVICAGTTSPESCIASGRALKQIVFNRVLTPNIITRDAVRGIYEWCLDHGYIDLVEYNEVLPPHESDPPSEARSIAELEATYNKETGSDGDISRPYGTLFDSLFDILGDFGTYTIDSILRQFTGHSLSDDRPSGGTQSIIPSEFARRWVFERVLSLGWIPTKFADFDSSENIPYAGRTSHKAERFGKKYQWIALRELAARLSDNFHMTDDFDGAPVSYKGPWQFMARDIDPTLPPASRERTDGDEFELRPTFPQDDASWRLPQEPEYHLDDEPVSSGWAANTDDIPKLDSLVRLQDESGGQWVVLHAYYDWDEQIPEEDRGLRPRRSLWSHVHSWLVKPEDHDAVVELIKRDDMWNFGMPRGREHTDSPYLGELPWAMSSDEYPDVWQPVRIRDDSNAGGIEVYPSWAEYLWEGAVLDCSINDSVQARIPAPFLFKRGKLRWFPKTREWYREDDEDCSVTAGFYEGKGHSVLLVREDWLTEVLKSTGYGIVFGQIGEKRLYEDRRFQSDILGDWTRFNSAASLMRGKWTFSEPTLKPMKGRRKDT